MHPTPLSLSAQVRNSCPLVSPYIPCHPSLISSPGEGKFTYHTTPSPSPRIRLPRRTPDAFQEAILLGQPVEAVVALSHRTHESAESVGLVLAGVAAVLVDLADADLD